MAAGTYPDENFAREIMQLFSIGLKMLHQNGTLMRDANGNDVQTYSNDDIMSFAKLWTGFDRQPFRGNIEAEKGQTTVNYVDPLQLKAAWRDVFPKRDLHGGFLGDR